MATTIEYALLAGASYYDTRAGINRFPVPQNWSYVSRIPSQSSGFEAAAFQSQCSNEIVISFAGTGPAGNGDWVHGNFPQALGMLGDQLEQAAAYYLQVRAANPSATITFTGHSLGGGLASLMAVMFNESATTFDQAPFANSALSFPSTDANGNPITTSVAQSLLTYLQSQVDKTNGQRVYTDTQLQNLSDYVTLLSTVPAGTIPNAANVYDINVHGEILGYLPQDRIGTQADLWQQNNMLVPQLDLHSQALLTAMLQSGDVQSATQPISTTPAHTLGQATYKLTDLLKMIFDPKLFYYDPSNKDKPQENFLEHLVRHQSGGVDGVQACGSTASDVLAGGAGGAIINGKAANDESANAWRVAA